MSQVPALAVSSPARSAAHAGSLAAGHWLKAGKQIRSPKGRYRLIMQTDGNLVEYGPSGALWATGTSGGGNRATMQTDGNLVVYSIGGIALWQSGTGGQSGTFVLKLQNNANLAIYKSRHAIWTRRSSLSAGSPDQTLQIGKDITSPNGAYELIMQTDGNLVEYSHGSALWATGTSGSGNHVTMQTDGNLVVYSSSGTALWQSGTGGQSGGFILDLENDGSLAAYGIGGLGVFWSRTSSLSAGSPDQSLSAGQSITSPNGAYELIMQTDGNLVEYSHGSALWATSTSGSGNHVIMQTDGNLVVYSGATELWQSGTGGHSGGFIADLQNDGNLVIYGVGGLGAIWSRAGQGSTLGSTIASIAQGQEGVEDSPANTYCNPYSAYWGDGTTCSNGLRATEWCADFAAWAWQQAGVSFTYGYGSSDVNAGAKSFYYWALAHGTWHPAGSGYTPQAGDVAVYGPSAADATHVGVVVSNGTIGPNVVNGDWEINYPALFPTLVDYQANERTEGGVSVVGYASP